MYQQVIEACQPGQDYGCVHAEVIEGIAPEELEKVLTGRKLLQACRKGKQMWMELDGGAPALMFHFGVWCL